MARMIKRKLSKKEQRAVTKTDALNVERNLNRVEEVAVEAKKKKVFLPDVVSVKEFADRANLPVTAIITELMKNGVLATINETIDFDTASIIGDDLKLEILKEEEAKKLVETEVKEKKIDKKNLVLRPPVVTIMGHVDHGKTTLLDNIRKAHVADSESGGITQHISAYQVTLEETKNKNLKNRTITFIDTPGHAAFSAMREHGAAITDIAVVIVAADDGVMPQTEEVIKAAAASNVPIIVAINKVDLPNSDVMKTKQQLTEFGLIPEEWGGKTVIVEISAKKGDKIDDLLEMILLQADMMELKADPKEKAIGVVIEAHMQKGRGAMALVLIENGTLKNSDPIAIGGSYGKVRSMQSTLGAIIKEASPSYPVLIAGLKSLPDFGDKLIVFENEKEARENAQKSVKIVPQVHVASAKRISETGSQSFQQEVIEFNIVLKADVMGSLEALKKTISEIKSPDFNIHLISEGIGPVAESDITLALATKSFVYGFRVNILGASKKIAEKEGVQVKRFDIIYELIDSIKEEIAKILPPEIIEEELGKGKVLAIFRDDRKGFVAGGRVEGGKISSGDEIKFYQDSNEKYRSKIESLRKEKSESKECESGSECGFGLPAFSNVSVGDEFVAFKTVHKKKIVI